MQENNSLDKKGTLETKLMCKAVINDLFEVLSGRKNAKF